MPEFPSPSPQAKRFQFSTRAMLLVMTAVAVLAAILPNNIVATILLFFVVGFAPLIFFVTAAIYARGWRQTFFIGATCAALLNRNVLGAYSMMSAADSFLYIAWVYFQYAMGGGLAILARLFIESRGWNLAPPPRDENPQK